MEALLDVILRLAGTGVVMAAILTGVFLFLYLLYRLIRLVQWLRKSPEERQVLRARKAAVARHPFSRSSGRDRAAYLVLCLEQALAAYSQAPEGWQWVLERLRALPGPKGETEPLFHAAVLLPFNVLPHESQKPGAVNAVYDELMDLWDPDRGQRYLSEERFRSLRALYLREGWRMGLFAPLLLAVYNQAYLAWQGGGASDFAALEMIDEAKALLYQWGVLPPRAENSGLA